MRRSSNNGSENGNEEEAKEIIMKEVQNVHVNPSGVKLDGCAACHVLFTLVDKMQISESNASDLLSQILFHDQQLNDSFIEMVEDIHMKQRKRRRLWATSKDTVTIDSNPFLMRAIAKSTLPAIVIYRSELNLK